MSSNYNGNAQNIISNLNTAKSIISSTNTNPTRLSVTGHGLTTGDFVSIAGHLTNTVANGVWQVTVIDANTFSIPVAAIAAGTGGTETPMTVGPVFATPSDGDLDAAASVNGALKALADRTAFIWSGLGAYYVRGGSISCLSAGSIYALISGAIRSTAPGGISTNTAGGITTSAVGGINDGGVAGGIAATIKAGISDGGVVGGVSASIPGGVQVLDNCVLLSGVSTYTVDSAVAGTPDDVVYTDSGVACAVKLPASPVLGRRLTIVFPTVQSTGLAGAGGSINSNGNAIRLSGIISGSPGTYSATPGSNQHLVYNLLFAASGWIQLNSHS